MVVQLGRLFRGNRDVSTLAVCIVFCLVCLTLPPRAKNAVSDVVSAGVLGPFRHLAMAAVELADVRTENARLRLLATELADERAGLIEYRHENERLRELLSFMVSFPEEEYLEMLPARVIGLPGGRTVESVEIDKGSRDGVMPGMPVVVPDGLVGKVSRVFHRRSLVEPLSSASSAVSAIVERSRVRGIVRPRYGPSSRLVSWRIDYVPARSDIVVDDLVVTSGLGGVYPPGLTLGRVTDVREGPLTTEIDVRLAVSLSEIEQVFVLTGRTDEPRARDAADAALLLELGRQRGGEQE